MSITQPYLMILFLLTKEIIATKNNVVLFACMMTWHNDESC